MQYFYGGIFLASLLLLPLYFLFIRKKQNEPWLFALFVCVSIVNLGYTLIAFSDTVEMALLANKVAYLGQVFIPLCMALLISKLCGYTCKKWVLGILIGIAVLMFALICTTGYLDWYYTDATIESIDGATVLHKEYGVLHPTNLIYVILYFIGMIAVIATSLIWRKSASQKHACGVLIIVLGNIAMWCVGKIIPWDVEFLSVTYLMSTWAFLIEWLMFQDYVRKIDVDPMIESKPSVIVMDSEMKARGIQLIINRLPDGARLTPRQRDVLEGILDGKSRKEIAADLHLSENTVKMHTSSLYRLLNVSSRDEIYSILK